MADAGKQCALRVCAPLEHGSACGHGGLGASAEGFRRPPLAPLPTWPDPARSGGHVQGAGGALEEQLPGRGWVGAEGAAASLSAVGVWLGLRFSDKPHTNFPWGRSDRQGLAGVGSGQASGSGHLWVGAVLGGGDMETWKMAGIQLEPLVSPLTRAVGIAHLNCSMSCFFP